jgi:hypothetical protein
MSYFWHGFPLYCAARALIQKEVIFDLKGENQF